MLNASALNGVGLNAAAGSRVQQGSAWAESGAAAASTAFILARPRASVVALARCVTAAFQSHATAADAVLAVSVLAALPRVRHASSSSTGAEAVAAAIADVTRYATAHATALSALAATGVRTTHAFGQASARASLAADDTVIAKPSVAAPATALAEASPCVTRHVAASVVAASTASASAGYAYSGVAAIAVRCAGFAAAGYGVPSLSVLGARADMYTYARQRHEALAEASRSRALVACTAVALCMGEASPMCRAFASASATAAQGTTRGLGGAVAMVASAEYWFLARSEAPAPAFAVARGDSALSALSALSATALVRVETTVNNELEGFADPRAVSDIAMVAQGVVVAPVAVHFWGTAAVQPEATYVHQSSASAPAPAALSPAALRVLMGAAFIPVAADAMAIGHWEWGGAATAGASVMSAGFALQRHQAFAKAFVRAAPDAQATWGHGAMAAIFAMAGIDAIADRHRMANATPVAFASTTVASAAQTHAATGCCLAEALALALAHWRRDGAVGLSCMADMLVESGQDHASTAASWAESVAWATASQDHGAELHAVATANDTSAACTHAHGATAAMAAFADALSTGSYGHMGLVDVPCPALCVAESIGNPAARDPSARTMSRPRVERAMARPFVDRAMKTTSA